MATVTSCRKSIFSSSMRFAPMIVAHCPSSALPHENLPFSSSSRHFPTTLLWSFLQDCNFAQLLLSSRRTWYSLERTRKIFHEANGGVVCRLRKQIAHYTSPEEGRVEKSLSYQAKREVLHQMAPQYREASASQKRTVLAT